MRAYVVDTLTMIVFFTTLAAVSELVVVGMAPEQVVVARLIMIPVMMATGRPYGIWRNMVFARIQPHRWFAHVATDITAFLTFQIPVYVITLVVAGATWAEILAAATTATIAMVLASRPYGVLLDVIRKRAGVMPA
jgi:hypothetical protein